MVIERYDIDDEDDGRSPNVKRWWATYLSTEVTCTLGITDIGTSISDDS